jgi:Tol biopolymer transport system component
MPLVLAAVVATAALSGCTFIERSDVPDSGLTQAGTSGSSAAPSANGRYVAFLAYGPLVASDGNADADIYVRDHLGDTTERVSVAADGGDSNGRSFLPSISGDGRYVLFASDATNLLSSGPTPTGTSLFVRDRTAGVTRRVPVTTDGQPIDGFVNGAALSADGSSVVATIGATNVGAGGSTDVNHVYVTDLDTGTTEQADVSSSEQPASDTSEGHGISGDGSRIVFVTAAPELNPGADGATNVFVRDRTTGTTSLVSATPNGDPGDGSSGDAGNHAITTNGRYVLFVSIADDLTSGDTPQTSDLFVRDLTTGSTERVVATTGVPAPGFMFPYGLSDDGRYVVGQGIKDFNHLQDQQPYLIDRVEQRRSFVATNPAQVPLGAHGQVPTISADGAYVTFETPDGTFLRSAVVPTLTAASPTTAARGATVDVTLTGTYLFPDPFVSFSGDGVTVTNVTVLDEHHARVTVQVAPDAEPGKRTAIFQNQGTGAGPRTGGLTVLVNALEVV